MPAWPRTLTYSRITVKHYIRVICKILATFPTSTYIPHMANVMIPMWTVGDRLVKARKHAGLKQTEIANLLGVSHGAVSAWETDSTPIKLGMLRAWAQVCQVSFHWLRHGDADKIAQSFLDQPVNPSEQLLLLDACSEPIAFDFEWLPANVTVLAARRAS